MFRRKKLQGDDGLIFPPVELESGYNLAIYIPKNVEVGDTITVKVDDDYNPVKGSGIWFPEWIMEPDEENRFYELFKNNRIESAVITEIYENGNGTITLTWKTPPEKMTPHGYFTEAMTGDGSFNEFGFYTSNNLTVISAGMSMFTEVEGAWVYFTFTEDGGG